MNRPLETRGEYTRYETRDSRIDLQNSRYTTRIRGSDRVSVHDEEIPLPSHQKAAWLIELKVVLTGGEENEFVGDTRDAQGRTTSIHLKNRLPDSLHSIHVVGQPEPISTEKATDELLLFLLQGKATLRESIFIRDIWFSAESQRRKFRHEEPADKVPTREVFIDLNESQAKADIAMILSPPELLVVQGEPRFV